MSFTPTCPLCQATAFTALSECDHGGQDSFPYSTVKRKCQKGHLFVTEETDILLAASSYAWQDRFVLEQIKRELNEK